MPTVPVDLWLPRFGVRLRALVPTLAEGEILAAALDTYRTAPDLDPEEAAEVFAQEPPAIDAASQGPDAPG